MPSDAKGSTATEAGLPALGYAPVPDIFQLPPGVNFGPCSGIAVNSLGNWSGTFTVPPSSSGSHVISAYGSVTLASSLSGATFVVTAAVASPAGGPPGSPVTVTAQEKKLRPKLASLKLSPWVELKKKQGKLVLKVKASALEVHSKLDGCYALKTDLPATLASAQVVHERYKDLALVEQNLRTMKTAELEMRPVYLRLEQTTRGHALVVMLAYRLIKELEKCWCQEDITVEEGLKQLDTLCLTELVVNGQVQDEIIPEPRAPLKRLLALAKVELPKKLRRLKLNVATKQKLPKYRPRRSK